MLGLHKKRLSEPDETVQFPGITEDLIEIGGFTVGKVTHRPGWRYSTDMARLVGSEWCETGAIIPGASE